MANLFVTENLGLQLFIFVGIIFFGLSFGSFFLRMFFRLVVYGKGRFSQHPDGPVEVSDQHVQKILMRLDYFKNLSEAGQERFRQRVEDVVERLEFSTAGNIEADEEKRVLIAAAAVQITFGLTEYDIDSIEHIKIFADDIYNPKNKVRYKGLTFLNGNMFISWKHFQEGIRAQDDGINLGLHETGHGLYILIKQFRGYGDFDAILTEWYKYAYPHIDHNNDGGEFFRKYADANIQEFFSICIENFFERPAQFKEKLPLIYGRLCTLLNQDPLNTFDYKFVPENVPMSGPPSGKLFLHKNRPHPMQGVLMWLSGVSVLAIILLKPLFLETLFNLLLFSIPCMFISYKLLKKKLLNTRRLSKKGYLLFCFTCVNPIVFVCFMLINLFVSSGVKGSRTYRIEGSEKYLSRISQNDLSLMEKEHFIYVLEENSTVPIDLRIKGQEEKEPLRIEYKYHYGITGMKILDGRELK